MSNYLAVATVTAALKELVQQALQVVPGKEVRVGRPEELSSDELARYGANLYLYHVVPNATFRNHDLATRSSDGMLIQRPQVALDLNYWIAFYSQKKDSQLESERMLGNVVSMLHAQPVLTREQLYNLIESPSYQYLQASNVYQQIEQITLMHVPLTLDELSKLWTIFSQASHRLSLFYQVSVVLIDAELNPQEALPVRSRQTGIAPHPRPVIQSITPEILEFSPQAKLTVTGENWGEVGAEVLLDEQPVPAQRVGAQEFVFSLPAKILTGIHSVQVLRSLQSGIGGGVHSNPVQFLLQPHVANSVHFASVEVARLSNELDPLAIVLTRIDTVAVTVTSEFGLGQNFELLLNEFQAVGSSARGYSFTTVLQFRIGREYESDLNNRDIVGLQLIFQQNRFPLSGNTSVIVGGGDRWLVQDHDFHQAYAIRESEGQLMVNYGVIGDDKDAINRTVFQVKGVEEGAYLVRVKLMGVPKAESLLRTDEKGLYSSPNVKI